MACLMVSRRFSGGPHDKDYSIPGSPASRKLPSSTSKALVRSTATGNVKFTKLRLGKNTKQQMDVRIACEKERASEPRMSRSKKVWKMLKGQSTTIVTYPLARLFLGIPVPKPQRRSLYHTPC